MHLDNRLQVHNMKLKGFQEGAEKTVDFNVFVANWITSALKLEDKIVPLIDAAFRLGPPQRAKNTMPRDIWVRFTDLCLRQQLLSEAHTKDFLIYGKNKILVFPDLLAETLKA